MELRLPNSFEVLNFKIQVFKNLKSFFLVVVYYHIVLIIFTFTYMICFHIFKSIFIAHFNLNMPRNSRKHTVCSCSSNHQGIKLLAVVLVMRLCSSPSSPHQRCGWVSPRLSFCVITVAVSFRLIDLFFCGCRPAINGNCPVYLLF